MNKIYIYKVYNPSGNTYLGILKNVVSPFTYNQTTGSASAQLDIQVEASADTAFMPVSAILDEANHTILDENGAVITDDGAQPLIGDAAAQINEDNIIKVWEYSKYNPNGVLRFTGYMSKINANFGSDDTVTITCLSQGQDLSQYLTYGYTQVQDQSQTTNDGSFDNLINGAPVGQTVQVGVGVTSISSVKLHLSSPIGVSQQANVQICDGVGGTVIASSTLTITSSTPADYTFTLNNSVAVSPGQILFISISSPFSPGINIYLHSGSSYTQGAFYVLTGSGWFQDVGLEMYFVTYTSIFNSVSTYTATDVSSVLSGVLSNYNLQGGLVRADPNGYAATGILMTYTFQVQTVLQAIETTFNNSPAGYYWFVDPASNIFKYGAYSQTPDILIVKGKHISTLDLTSTKENIVNKVYFTGGDDGTGTNIFVVVSENTTGRTGIAQLTDNRISAANIGTKNAATAAAAQVAQAYIDRNSLRSYMATVTIQDGTMDTSLLQLGKTVGFSGFGTFIDTLVLPIVGVNPGEDQTSCQIGSLPVRSSARTKELSNQLNAVQTLDNPGTAT